MADSDVTIASTGLPSTGFNPRNVDRGGGVREPVHSLAKIDGARINPATAEGVEALRLLLATPALPIGAATDATLEQARALLASILTAIQAQRVETIWTDDTGARFIRAGIGGAIVWMDVAGNAASAPGAGARPDNDSGSVASRQTFKATAGGTGFSTGDVLDHLIVADESGDPVGNFWINVNTGLKIAAPAAGSIAIQNALPDGAAKDATVASIVTALAGLLTVAGKDAVGAAPSSMPVQLSGVDAAGLIRRLLTDAAGASIIVQKPFQPLPGATKSVTAGPTATAAGSLPLAANGAIAVGAATAYRVRNAASSASPVTWILTADPAKTPTIPTPSAADGTGGVAGDKTIDPGSVEVISLSAAQQAALTAGTLYLSAVTPAGGSAVLSITPGIGA